MSPSSPAFPAPVPNPPSDEEASPLGPPDAVRRLEGGARAGACAWVRYRRAKPGTGLRLFLYTPRCVYEDGWDEFTLLARGLIVDQTAGRIVATPFTKFFNLGERQGDASDLAFEAYEKLDGRLIIVFHHDGRWQAATNGAFDSAQAVWAQAWLYSVDLSAVTPGTTYLFEAATPENRIVVRYDEPALIMLAAFTPDGRELSFGEVLRAGEALGWRAAGRRAFAAPAEMTRPAAVGKDQEGFVVRFSNGLRLKLKGAEYRRIHVPISRCTPMAIWEALNAGEDPDAIRCDLPKELWGDFDDIVSRLRAIGAAIARPVEEVAASVADLSDKDLGLAPASIPKEMRPYLFGFRKAEAIEGRARDSAMHSIRPAANVLP